MHFLGRCSQSLLLDYLKAVEGFLLSSAPWVVCSHPWVRGGTRGLGESLPVLVQQPGGLAWGAALWEVAGHSTPLPSHSSQWQEGLLTASLNKVSSQRRGLWRIEQCLLGLVDDTCCCVVPWVPWGSTGAVPEPPLPTQPWLLCVLPDVFQNPSGSWHWSLLL